MVVLVPVDPEALLGRIVDALVVGTPDRPPRALLVQKNTRDATVVVDSDRVLILIAWPRDGRPGAGVTGRLEAALAAERPRVLTGLANQAAATVLLVGGNAPLADYVDRLPRTFASPALSLQYLRTAGGDLEGVPPDRPAGVIEPPPADTRLRAMADVLRPVLRAIEDDDAPPAAPPEALAASEKQGEHLLAAEGQHSSRLALQYTWIGALVAVQGVVLVAWYVFGGGDAALGRMGSASGAAIRAGQWWRLMCASYLHAGVVHYLSNALATVMFGAPVGSALGIARTLILFHASAAGGFLFAAWVRPGEDGVGASGGVFGLMVALLMLSRGRELLPRASRKGWGLFAGIYLVLNLFASLKPGVSMLGHLGGGITGGLLVGSGLIGLGLPELDSDERIGPLARWVPRLLLVAIAAVVLASFTVALRHERPWGVRWPPEVVRVFLTGSEFAVDVPRSLSETMDGEDGDAYHQYRLGTMSRDPMVVSIIVRARRAESPADDAAAVAALVPHFTKKGPGDDLTWRKPPATLTLEGRSYVFIDQVATSNDEYLFPRWVTVDGDRELDIEIGINPDATSRWVALRDQIVASLVRREGAPP